MDEHNLAFKLLDCLGGSNPTLKSNQKRIDQWFNTLEVEELGHTIEKKDRDAIIDRAQSFYNETLTQ